MISLNINDLDLLNALEKTCPNSDSVLASYKALLSLGSQKSEIPMIEKPTPVPVVTRKPKQTWSYGMIDIGENFLLVNRKTGFMFRVKDIWAKKNGLVYAGRDMSKGKKYVAQSIIDQMEHVVSVTGHDQLIEGKKTTPDFSQWEVRDAKGVSIGKTVLDCCRAHNLLLPPTYHKRG